MESVIKLLSTWDGIPKGESFGFSWAKPKWHFDPRKSKHLLSKLPGYKENKVKDECIVCVPRFRVRNIFSGFKLYEKLWKLILGIILRTS